MAEKNNYHFYLFQLDISTFVRMSSTKQVEAETSIENDTG